MAVNPVFPRGIVPWVPRVDKINIVYALDPNTLAAEIGSIESTLGIQPQVEPAPPSGSPVVYSTVGARLHDIQVGTQEPTVTLTNGAFNVNNSAPTGTFNSYNVLLDPFNWYNGNDVTVAADCWATVTANQMVDWWSSGYMHLTLYIDSTWVTDDHWSWDFPANNPGGRWNGRNHVMSVSWQGVIHSGQRVRVKTENGTGKTQIGVSSAFLRVKYDRQITPHNQQG